MSSKSLKYSALLAACLGVAALAGCGSSNKSGSAALVNVGDTECLQCHSEAKDPLTQESITDQYARSAHYASGQGCESCHGAGSLHHGSGPIPYPAPDAARCATCHTGTNSTVFAAALLQEGAENNPSTPSNHANGGYEGVATGEPCYRCHSHEGAVLSNVAGYTGNYGVSAAGNADGILSNNVYKLVQDRDFTKFKGIQCATCHEHGGALRVVKTRNTDGNVVAWDPNGNRKVDQFDLCTSCHNYLDNDGTTLIASGSAASGDKPKTNYYYHSTSWYRVIASTHWDNPATTGTQASATADVTNTPIEGYVIRKNGATPCFDCHGHEAKANTRPTDPPRPSTIHTDWAQSAHAGHLLENKYATAAGASSGQSEVDEVMNTYTDDITGIAWTHYNWDNSTGTARGAGDQDRKSCQKCHTATGIANFLNDPAGYDPANNDFSHLSGWVKYNSRSNPTYAKQTSPQQEVLYCWGCHSNAGTGELRNPGALTVQYTGAPETYPNIGNSNLCLACHTGQQSGNSVKATTGDFSNLSFINSHYLAAGGTVFGKTGYQYDGSNRSYDSSANNFVHDKLGVSATGIAAADAYIANNGLSSSGPCAVCHMTSEKLGQKTSHTYSPFSEYASSDVSLNPVCVTCHTTRGAGTNAKAGWFEGTWKLRSDAALDALKAQLAVRGFNYTSNYPYFAAKNWLSAGDTDTTGNTTGKHNLGAAFNYNLLVHDPGAVAHNRYYVRRLIYDSIDWLDNNTLDFSVSTTLNALDPVAHPYKTDAITFLINSEGTVGTATERY